MATAHVARDTTSLQPFGQYGHGIRQAGFGDHVTTLQNLHWEGSGFGGKPEALPVEWGCGTSRPLGVKELPLGNSPNSSVRPLLWSPSQTVPPCLGHTIIPQGGTERVGRQGTRRDSAHCHGSNSYVSLLSHTPSSRNPPLALKGFLKKASVYFLHNQLRDQHGSVACHD